MKKVTVKVNGKRVKGVLPPGCYDVLPNGVVRGTAYLVDGRVCYCEMACLSRPKSTIFRFKGWAN